MYLLNCDTCGTKRLFDDLESAQPQFNDHAEDHHEVEIINLDSKIEAARLDVDDIKAEKTPDRDPNGNDKPAGY